MTQRMPLALALLVLGASALAQPGTAARGAESGTRVAADSSCEVAPGITLSGCGFSEDVQVSSGHIAGPGQAVTVDLASGERLRLDGRTSSGRYRLADGSSVDVFGPPGYPRELNWRTRPIRAIRFAFPEDAELGLYVEAASPARADRPLLERFAESFDPNASSRGAPSLQWGRHPGDPVAMRLPRSWHREAVVEIPADLGREVRVSWLEFPAPLLPVDAGVPPSRAQSHVAATIASATLRASVVLRDSTRSEGRSPTNR